jgi:hypothetical protein
MKNVLGVILLCVSSACFAASPVPVAPAALKSPHVITGTLTAINGSTLSIETRARKTVTIDAYQAIKNERVAHLKVGQPLTAQGSFFNAAGALQATSISRAKASSALWPPDF